MTKFAHDNIVPDKASNLNKKEQVATMFNDIAKRYDFLNRLLSEGIDKSWRKKAIAELKEIQPKKILDVATGTADVALMTYKLLKPEKIIGIDISDGMIALGKEKITKQGLTNFIELQNGDSEKINYTNNFFDAVTVAFGVRNFQNLEKGLGEMLRVLKPGGKLVILEFSKPCNTIFKSFYNFYMKIVAPKAGSMFAKNKDAYKYLNDSVQAFPEREHLTEIMKNTGYKNVYFKQLTLGICCVYCGSK